MTTLKPAAERYFSVCFLCSTCSSQSTLRTEWPVSQDDNGCSTRSRLADLFCLARAYRLPEVSRSVNGVPVFIDPRAGPGGIGPAKITVPWIKNASYRDFHSSAEGG